MASSARNWTSLRMFSPPDIYPKYLWGFFVRSSSLPSNYTHIGYFLSLHIIVKNRGRELHEERVAWLRRLERGRKGWNFHPKCWKRVCKFWVFPFSPLFFRTICLSPSSLSRLSKAVGFFLRAEGESPLSSHRHDTVFKEGLGIRQSLQFILKSKTDILHCQQRNLFLWYFQYLYR